MLRSCPYCGKFHKRGEVCEKKPKLFRRTERKQTDKDYFRNTSAWQKKRQQIRERDFNCCRLCLIQPAPNARRINTKHLSVHHIIPLEEDFERRLDDNNLITLCSYHHELAEAGEVSVEQLRVLITSPPMFSQK